MAFRFRCRDWAQLSRVLLLVQDTGCDAGQIRLFGVEAGGEVVWSCRCGLGMLALCFETNS